MFGRVCTFNIFVTNDISWVLCRRLLSLFVPRSLHRVIKYLNRINNKSRSYAAAAMDHPRTSFCEGRVTDYYALFLTTQMDMNLCSWLMDPRAGRSTSMAAGDASVNNANLTSIKPTKCKQSSMEAEHTLAVMSRARC